MIEYVTHRSRYWNTAAGYGTGAFLFFGELPNVNLQLIWILRTAGYESTLLYAANGVVRTPASNLPLLCVSSQSMRASGCLWLQVFCLAFIVIRTVVLGWYMKQMWEDVLRQPEHCMDVRLRGMHLSSMNPQTHDGVN